MKRKLLSALLATAMTMTVVAGTGIAVSADGEAVVSTVMFSDPDTMDPGRADDDQKNSIGELICTKVIQWNLPAGLLL